MHPSAIDMEHHIRDLPEAAGWGQREIDAFVSKEYAASKDVTMPLWMFYVMNNLADGRSCILVNIDHSIGDGISLVQVMSEYIFLTRIFHFRYLRTEYIAQIDVAFPS
jgi:hypothetical protein